MVGAPELIIFAIQSAIKLGEQARLAYIDSTKGAALVLPLPDFSTTATVQQAATFFNGMAPEKWPATAVPLMAKIKNGTAVSEDEKAVLVGLFLDAQPTPGAADAALTRQALDAMVKIRQWDPHRNPNPSALQRVAGTLIEIGVQYVATTPGLISETSPQGRAVHALLGALDTVDFATVDLQELPARLLTSTLDTLSTHADVISSNAHIQTLVQLTAGKLALNARDRLAASRAAHGPDLTREDRIVEWADIVYRSVLQGAGAAVAHDPATFLGVKDAGQGALISHVGEALLSFALDGHDGQAFPAIGKGALDAVLKAALSAIGEHPELVAKTRNGGLNALLVETAKSLSGFGDLLSPAIVPEVAQLILTGTARNLELIWPAATAKPADHLLLTAARATLEALTKQAPGDSWKPSFSASDATGIVSRVVDELVDNPGWLVDRTGKLSGNLAAALGAVFGVLRTKADARLSPATASAVVSAALSAIALRPALLQKLGAGAGDQLKIAAAIEAVVAPIFQPGLDPLAAAPLIRSVVIENAVRIGLDRLGRTDLGDARFAKFRTAVQAELNRIAGGAPWDPAAFAQAVEQALA